MSKRIAHAASLASLLLLTVDAAAAQPVSGAIRELDRYVLAHAANGDFNGSLLITSRGKILYSRNYGAASLRFRVPIGNQTRFAIASVTKTFTAAAIALLVADGKLRIEDSIDNYLPGFPRGNEIKIWHLLVHQSGVRNPDDSQIAGRNLPPDDLVELIAAKPLAFAPGSGSAYSNAGYVLLARIVERVSGMPFAVFLKQRIFDPLNMTASGQWRSGEIVQDMAEGYVAGVGTSLRRGDAYDPSALFGSGSVFSTAVDLDRWLTAIDNKKLFDISRQPYPFGWGKRTWFDRDIVVQSGEIPGYSAIILTVPAEQLHVVLAMNMDSGFTADEGKTILGILYGNRADLPGKRTPPPTLPAAALTALAGHYLWGPNKTAMHIDATEDGLTLRWGNAINSVLLTPLSSTEFVDRSTFAELEFKGGILVWKTKGAAPMQCPRAR